VGKAGRGSGWEALSARFLGGFRGVGAEGLGFGVRALTNSVGPSLARIMEQSHVGQTIAIVHMATSTQDLGVPGDR
jgi:hypothetical protein